MAEKECIYRETALAVFHDWIDKHGDVHTVDEIPEYEAIENLPAADVVEEENVLKFYYVRSIDEYWIGRRIDNFYYAEYDASCGQWVWSHSRYLPWGQHVVAPDTLWKEHTYPSEPEEIPFGEWLTGFIKKNNDTDVEPVRHGRWVYNSPEDNIPYCSECLMPQDSECNFCPSCGAKMGDEDVQV